MTDKLRKPWIAGLLTLFTIGLGHLYSGKAKKGIVLYFLGQGTILAIFLFLIWLSPNILVFLLAVLCGLGFLIFCILDAIRVSRRNKLTYELKKYNRWYVYVLVLAVNSFLIQPAVESTIKSDIVQAYRIPSGAMKPTLQIGDHILADKYIYKKTEPKRGDIVIFPFPEDPSKDFIKRVVAVSGETIEIIDKQISINGEIIEETFVIHTDSNIFRDKKRPRDNFGPVKVPDDSLFVMGDNRDHSYDSRFWGFVKKASVKGKVASIYWSWDKESSSVRWNRIGSKVR